MELLDKITGVMLIPGMVGLMKWASGIVLSQRRKSHRCIMAVLEKHIVRFNLGMATDWKPIARMKVMEELKIQRGGFQDATLPINTMTTITTN